MTSYTVTEKQIEESAQEMSKVTPWGFEEYIKVNGEWKLECALIVEKDMRRTHKVYADNRPTEIINWAV